MKQKSAQVVLGSTQPLKKLSIPQLLSTLFWAGVATTTLLVKSLHVPTLAILIVVGSSMVITLYNLTPLELAKLLYSSQPSPESVLSLKETLEKSGREDIAETFLLAESSRVPDRYTSFFQPKISPEQLEAEQQLKTWLTILELAPTNNLVLKNSVELARYTNNNDLINELSQLLKYYQPTTSYSLESDPESELVSP